MGMKKEGKLCGAASSAAAMCGVSVCIGMQEWYRNGPGWA